MGSSSRNRQSQAGIAPTWLFTLAPKASSLGLGTMPFLSIIIV